MVNKLYEIAGINDHISGLHVLRRTFATELFDRGYTAKEVAAYLGDDESTVNSTNLEGESSRNKSLPQAETPCPGNPSQYNTKDTKYIKEKNKEYKNKECEEDTLPDDQYESLVRGFGKESVDYQISRIKNSHYKFSSNERRYFQMF